MCKGKKRRQEMHISVAVYSGQELELAAVKTSWNIVCTCILLGFKMITSLSELRNVK